MVQPKYSLHLFAGAGGGVLADTITGITPLAAVEIEHNARKMLLRRFPELIVWDDIRTFRADNPECAAIFEQFREIRQELAIAGGFPCQDISPPGSCEGIRGKKSGLWFEYARVICEIFPQFVFVENSSQLVNRGFELVLGKLAAMGYHAAWGVLEASEVGALHERSRIWITATLANAE